MSIHTHSKNKRRVYLKCNQCGKFIHNKQGDVSEGATSMINMSFNNNPYVIHLCSHCIEHRKEKFSDYFYWRVRVSEYDLG